MKILQEALSAAGIPLLFSEYFSRLRLRLHFRPRAPSARLPPRRCFSPASFLSSPRLPLSPPSSFLLCLAFSLPCPAPLLRQAFFKQLVLSSASTSSTHSKGAETSHVWEKMKKKKKKKNNPYNLDLFAQRSLPPSSHPLSLPSPSATLHPALRMFLPIQNVVCLSSLKCFSSRLLHQN